MAKTLTLTGPLKGKTLKCMMHSFTDGELVVQKDEEADKIFRVLKKFYPVKISEPPAPEPEVVPTPYLQPSGARTVDPNVKPAEKPKPAVKEAAKTDK